MADKKDKGNIFNDKISPAALKELQQHLKASNEKLQRNETGLAVDKINALSVKDELQTELSATVNTIMASMQPGGKNDIKDDEIDTILALSTPRPNRKNKINSAEINKVKKSIDELKNSINVANGQNIEEMIALHKTKYTDALSTYNLIIRIIPKMRLALNTFATSILSPDDFTKSKLNINIVNSSLTKEESNILRERVEEQFDRLNINKYIKEDILRYLITGRLFYHVTSVDKQIVKLLNENNAVTGQGSHKNIDNSYFSNICENVLSENSSNPNAFLGQKEFIKEFKEIFSLNESNKDNLKKAAATVDDIISEEFIISDSRTLHTTNHNEIITESEGIEQALNFFNQSLTEDHPLHSDVPHDSYNNDSNHNNVVRKKVKLKDIKGDKIALIKRISPANIVPLNYNEKNYGYIHLDIVEIDPDGDVLPVDSTGSGDSNTISPTKNGAFFNGSVISGIISQSSDVPLTKNNGGATTSNGKTYENPNQSPALTAGDDARLKFLADVFANKLSHETNLKLLKKNSEFKNAIYNSLAIKKLQSNQKIRVVYLPPSEVVFIDRGNSIFDNVLFFCKIYIATLITILMQNILNGGEKRAIYVEVGEDNDSAQVVNQVVKDIKSREVSSIIGMDVHTILNIQSQFQDYYIPVVDGEKPVSFETIDNLSNKNIDDDLLKWLGDQIYSGIGTPSAFLNEVDNIDFAKMLSMQNSRYLREVLSEQNILSVGFTELARKIYAIEYGFSDSSIQNFNFEDIDASLPVPAALALITIADQFSNAGNIIDSILQFSDHNVRAGIKEEDSEDKNKLEFLAKAKLIRNLVPSANWNDLDRLMDSAIEDFVAYKIRDKNAPSIESENDMTSSEDMDDTEDASEL